MKVAIISQARMTSTRLPGKVMKTILGKTLIGLQVERLRRVRNADCIVVATTTNASDDALAEHCRKDLGVAVFRGDENDVLARYHGAAKEIGADVVVRVTSDCPVIDPEVSAALIGRFLESRSDCDYLSNTLDRTYPRGMDTEVMSFAVLDIAFREARKPYEREHVTPFLYGHPERFRIQQFTRETDDSIHRWTVDTPEDFELVKRIVESLYPQNASFSLEDILKLLRQHPDWARINAHVEQKKLGE